MGARTRRLAAAGAAGLADGGTLPGQFLSHGATITAQAGHDRRAA